MEKCCFWLHTTSLLYDLNVYLTCFLSVTHSHTNTNSAKRQISRTASAHNEHWSESGASEQ